MLLAGGVTTMEYATLIFALPVTIIAYLVMVSFYKVLRMERAEREGHVLRRQAMARTAATCRSGVGAAARTDARVPVQRQVAQFLDRTVRPALDECAAEFRNQGYDVEQGTMTNARPASRSRCCGCDGPPRLPLPGRHRRGAGADVRRPDVARDRRLLPLEVFTQTGSGGYDLMGLTKQQIIDDVLDRYEAHLAFLAYSSEYDHPSIITPQHHRPPVPPHRRSLRMANARGPR